jgi:hypothetical protein
MIMSFGCWSKCEVALALVLVYLFACGCGKRVSHDQGSGSGLRPQASDDPVKGLDNMYRDYLQSSNISKINAARRMVEVLEATGDKRVSVDNLWLAYARLAYAEELLGHSDQAAIAFEKARYWWVVSLESAGLNASNIVLRMNAFTREKCSQDLERWDSNER